jgi:hypothetical protein
MFTATMFGPQATIPAKKPGAWHGSIPYLKLILCLTEDKINQQFLVCDHALSQTELDACNCAIQQPSVHKMMADLWNDASYNPVLPAFSVHSDYQMLIDRGYFFERERYDYG